MKVKSGANEGKTEKSPWMLRHYNGVLLNVQIALAQGAVHMVFCLIVRVPQGTMDMIDVGGGGI